MQKMRQGDYFQNSLFFKKVLYKVKASGLYTILFFGQCWPRIFFLQCWRNLNNVAAAFATTGTIKKINQSKIKIAKNWPEVVQNILHWIFSCVILSGAFWTTLHRVFLRNVVPVVLRLHCTGFFSVMHSRHHSWVTGTLGCKSGTKNGRNSVKVLLERYEQE